jgi:hypothetical protein
MRRLLPYALVAVAASLITAGAIAIPALADDQDDPVRSFEDCLREHGFLPEDGRLDVQIRPDGVWLNGEKVDAEAFREARRECGPPLRGLLPALPSDGDLEERMDRLRDCLEQRSRF